MAQDTTRQRDEDTRRRQTIVVEREAYYRARDQRALEQAQRESRYRQQRIDERKWQQTMEGRRNTHS